MKNRSLYILFIALFTCAIFTLGLQAQQLPNANFEDWSGTPFDGIVQPKSWNASNISQFAFNFNFAHRETGHTGNYSLMVQDQEVGVASITEICPGYASLGTPWVHIKSLTELSEATAGDNGGIDFTYRPDTMAVWIKRTGNHTADEDFHLLYYSWISQSKGDEYKGKNGNCISVTKYDEESDIRQATNGNECGTTTEVTQIAEGWLRARATYSNWTLVKVPIYYNNDQQPTRLNVIFSASNYPNFRTSDGLYAGNSLYVDDVQLIYSSKIQHLYIDGSEWLGFDPNNTEEQIYSLGQNATTMPTIAARRGEGSLTNTKGVTAMFAGRQLGENEMTITQGVIDGAPTIVTVSAEDGSSTTNYKIKFVRADSTNAPEAQNNVITYTATSKLTETTSTYSSGLHTNAFNVAITSHTFANGVGTITFAGDVTTFGNYAFNKCTSLTSVTIPNSVTTIGNHAFDNCSGLTSITIPNSVTTIGDDAFYECSGVTSVIIPNSVTTIGKYAFENCSGLTSITIPHSVTTIGDCAFRSCSGLKSINVDAANTHYTSIDGVLFNHAKDTLIQYPIGNTRTQYTIPNSATTIGKRAFSNCSGLTSVTIPSSVTTIGEDAFSNCIGLTSVTIPNSVTTIGQSAFYYCTGLTSVTIPNSVTTIGEWAFSSCSGLTSVTIPNSVTTIGESAFFSCSGLTSVTIPNSVTTIGESAFYDCIGLTSVTIPNSVTTIGDWAFLSCSELTSINVDAANTHYASIDGVLFNHAKDTLIQYPIGNTRTQYTIPSSVTTIGWSAFNGCSSLTSITIPNSVTTIGEDAFNGCTGLISVTIPNSVTTIGDRAFEYCRGLTSVTIPNSVTTIGYRAFYDCSGLTSITCQATTPPTCGNNCFFKVSTSIHVYVPAGSVDAYKNANEWKIFTNIQPIPSGDDCEPISGTCGANLTWTLTCDSVLTISGTGEMYDYNTKNHAPWYSNRNNIKYCIIEDGVTTIGDYAFRDCSCLTSVTIPNSATTIGDFAFCGCSSLTSVIIPASVSTIGIFAFGICTGLTSITNYISTPPVCDSCFHGVNLTIPLYVPYSSIDAYQATDQWSDFTNIQPIPGTEPQNNVITYTATEKLTETTSTYSRGLHTNAFNVAITSHTFANGVGTITFAGDVTTIGERAFYLCSGLTSVTIPNSITTIGQEAFANCFGLTSVTIPNSVTTIGQGAFANCSDLTSINVDAMNTHYCSIDGVLFNYAKDTLIQYPIGNTRTQYTIPNSVTTIGYEAFYRCSGLTFVMIPNSVTTIGQYAFYSCSKLTSVTIPNSVTTIGNCAFYLCSGLTSVTCEATIPPTCGSPCFEYVDKSIPLYVPKSSISAYQKANEWKEFTNIQAIPGTEPQNNVITYKATSKLTETTKSTTSGLHTNAFNVTITSHTFANGVGTITFAGDVTTIGHYAFSYCNGLTSITIPNSVTTIGDKAFDDCKGLTSITIPNSVSSIGNYAFRNCNGLTSITIPNSVTTIGKYAFYDCDGLTSINVDATNTHYASIDGVLFNYAKDTLIQYPIGNTRTQYTIPSSVTTIGNNAFESCSKLTSITIPNSVTTIGDYAFYYCSKLTSITCQATTPPTCGSNCFDEVSTTIPLYVPKGSISAYQKANKWKNFTNIQPIGSEEPKNNVIIYTAKEKLNETSTSGLHTNAFNVAITSHTFSNGTGTITFAGDVTTIGNRAFYNCSGMTSIMFPNSVTTIEGWAFSDCSGLTSIEIPNSVTTIGDNAFAHCKGLTSITIPNSVTTIKWSAFFDCSGLTSVTIGNSVTTIEDHAFSCCRSLTSINVDPSNKYYVSVDGVLFNYAKNTLIQYPIGNSKSQYTIPNSVTTIESEAFRLFTSLTSITIPNSVKTIGNWAFYDCSGLTSVTIGNSVTTIGEKAFYCCRSLTSINVDPSNKYYVSVDGVLFNYAKNTLIQYPIGNTRTQYTIPNSVTTIGEYAFYDCSGLTSVTISNSVTTIGNEAFYECSGLTSVTCQATTPPMYDGIYDNYCFYHVSTSIPLYVPKGSIDTYKTANVWKDFTNIQAIGDFDINNITTTVSELEAWVMVPLDANGEVTKYSYWLYLDNAHTDLVCSMDFNATGKMSNPVIRKAPMRQLAEEEQTFDSFTFEVSGLEANTTYYYVLKAYTNAKTFTKEGSFTTQSSVTRNASSQVKKVCKHNKIYIESGDKTFDIWGNLISQ